MTFKEYFSKGIEIVKLNRDAADEVAAQEDAFGMAMLFFAIGGLAAGLGSVMVSLGFGFFMLIFFPVMHVVGSFIWTGILFLLARLFGGTGTFKAHYSALGIGSLPGWAQIVPVLGGIVALWNIPVSVIVTERIHKISTGKAVAVVLIPMVFIIILALIAVVMIGMAAFMGMMSMGQMPDFKTF